MPNTSYDNGLSKEENSNVFYFEWVLKKKDGSKLTTAETDTINDAFIELCEKLNIEASEY